MPEYIVPLLNILAYMFVVLGPAETQPCPDLLNQNLHFKRSSGHLYAHKNLKRTDLHDLMDEKFHFKC